MQAHAPSVSWGGILQPMEQREQKPNLFGLCRNIVQTRAESSLLGYAECSRYSTKLIATEEDDSQPFRWSGTWEEGGGCWFLVMGFRFLQPNKNRLITICNINAFIMQYQRFCFAMSQMSFSHVSAQVSFQNSLDTLTNNKTTKQLWCPVSDWRRACITVLSPLCRMPQCHRQVIALLVARTVRHWETFSHLIGSYGYILYGR